MSNTRDELLKAFEADEKNAPDTVEIEETQDVNSEPTDARQAAPGGAESIEKPGNVDESEGAEKKESGATAREQNAPPPPVRWTAEQKALFERGAALGGDAEAWAKEIQKAVADQAKGLQGDYTSKTQQLAAQRAEFEAEASRARALEDAIADFIPEVERTGADLPGYARQVFALSKFAQEDPVGFARSFIQGRNLSPEQLGLTTVAQETIVVVDESGQTLATYLNPNPGQPAGAQPTQRQQSREEMTAADARQMGAPPELIERLERTERYLAHLAERDARQINQANYGRLVNFRDEKGADGEPLRPFFDDVQQDMARLIDAGYDLDSAYQAAVAARPELREKARESERIAWQRRQSAEARAKRDASASLRTSGGSAGGAPSEKSPFPENSTAALMSKLWDRSAAGARL